VNLLVEHYRAMASYNAWANRRLHEVRRRLYDQAFALPLTSFFPSIPLTLNHILLVDRYYVPERASPDYSIFADKVCYPTMTELSPVQRDLDRRLISVCNSLDAVELKRVVVLDRGADGIRRERLHRSCLTLSCIRYIIAGRRWRCSQAARKKHHSSTNFSSLPWPARDRELAMPTNSAQAATLRRRR
jgi:uncharacterized damage-inducible protein DinB